MFSQHPMLIVGDGNGERAVKLAPVGQQLLDRPRIDHRARQDVGADLRALLQDADRKVAPGLGGELLEADRGGEAGRAGANDNDVISH
jgi:hypothetical protein